MEEGKGERYLAPGRQYGNALLGVRHQEEERTIPVIIIPAAGILTSVYQYRIDFSDNDGVSTLYFYKPAHLHPRGWSVGC